MIPGLCHFIHFRIKKKRKNFSSKLEVHVVMENSQKLRKKAAGLQWACTHMQLMHTNKLWSFLLQSLLILDMPFEHASKSKKLWSILPSVDAKTFTVRLVNKLHGM